MRQKVVCYSMQGSRERRKMSMFMRSRFHVSFQWPDGRRAMASIKIADIRQSESDHRLLTG